jgi:hypothetical protein
MLCRIVAHVNTINKSINKIIIRGILIDDNTNRTIKQ